MPGVLYRKEREVLEYIVQFQKQFGYSPTLKEIAQATGHRANSTIHSLIRSLVDKGYIQKVDGNTRVLKILDHNISSKMLGSQPSIELPVMGYLIDGKPLEPHEDPNASYQISTTLISGRKTAYILVIKGENLKKEGIMENDYIIIEKTDDVKDNDIVLVTIDKGVVYLKRYHKNSDSHALLPIHTQGEPVSVKDCVIQGKCVGVVRSFL